MPANLLNAATARIARALNNRWAKSLRIAPTEWTALNQELDRWHRAGRRVRMWWRDDDASDSTPALEDLLQLRAGLGVPLAVAAIPATATPHLADALKRAGNVRVLQHGWSHKNHAPNGGYRAELAVGRPAREVAAELAMGQERARALFGELFLPVLVPPFNFLSRSLAGIVSELGFGFVSVEGDFAGLPLPCRNVQIDPIDWRAGTAKDPGTLVRQALAALRLRRLGLIAHTAPIGLVTHHLRHDSEIWALTGALLDRLVRHPAVVFAPIERVFSP
jgi:hypothetical protein